MYLKTLIKKCAWKLYNLALQYQREEQYKKYNFPNSVTFDNVSFDGNITIGEHTYINEGSRIDTGVHSKVIIGKHCAIGRFVHITSKTHDLARPTTDTNNNSILHHEADTIVGDEVWIGDCVYIKEGIKIGNNAIIGAHSVVLKDVAPFAIVAGVPAKQIRFNIEHYKYHSWQDAKY